MRVMKAVCLAAVPTLLLSMAACSSSSKSAGSASSGDAATSTAAATDSAGVSAPAEASSPAAAAPTTLTKIKVVSYPGSDSSWLVYIADQQGYFKQNGLEVSPTALPAGTQGTAALVGGSVDIAVLDMNNLAPLLAKNQSFKLLINDNINFWELVGNKSLVGKSLQDTLTSLKGSSVNAPSVGGTGGRQLQLMLTAYGMSTSDVQLVADPTNASLTAGKVGASMTDTVGACRIEALGYPELMNFVNPPQDASSYPPAVQRLVGLAGLGYWSTGSWADKNAATVTAFQKAIAAATTWAKDPANAAAVASMLRNSDFNVKALTDSQWSACVARVVAGLSNAFTPKDVSTWTSIVAEEGIASSLPATSDWQAAGLPQS